MRSDKDRDKVLGGQDVAELSALAISFVKDMFGEKFLVLACLGVAGMLADRLFMDGRLPADVYNQAIVNLRNQTLKVIEGEKL